jgi:group II intron reverse transcriptase/maturase
MEEVVRRDNLKAALGRVRQNQGSPGIDGMKTEELLPYLREHWSRIREQLLAGTYRPSPVKRQEIPKKGGGVRQLGIPTVLDRFIQQAVLQVLQPRFDPTFSEHSYGFRPGRSAQQAVAQAQRHVEEGRRYVVDVDLEKFFGAPGQAWRLQRVQFPPRQGERAAPPGIESWAHEGNDMS